MDSSLFIKKDEPSTRLELLITQDAKNKSVIGFSDSFKADTITECPRRLVYRSTGVNTSCSSETFFREQSNSYRRLKWQYFFSKCKSIRLLKENLLVADCNYNITSIVDAILSMDEELYVVKIEPLDNSSYNKVKQSGAFKKHVVEIMVNMWLAEINAGLLLYENKDNDEFDVYHIEPYKPIIQSIGKKCSMMFDCKVSGKLPEKPYKERNSNECNACEFADKCWKK